jgi:alkylated DNA repair dioxygenase AlkB
LSKEERKLARRSCADLVGEREGNFQEVRMRTEVTPGHWVEYIEDFLSKEEADQYLRAFLELKATITPEAVTMFGRTSLQKRLSVQYGADYIYNKTAKKSHPWTPPMLEIKGRMEAVAGPLHGGLLWIYPDGDAGLGWHEDKGNPEVIASLSLGAERIIAFGIGPVVGCREVFRMRLAHGSLLLIPAETNEATKHRVPPERRVKEPRVNVTLRRFPR